MSQPATDNSTGTGADPELNGLAHRLDRYLYADTRGSHVGINGGIALQQRDAMAARIAGMRGGLAEAPEPPRDWTPVAAFHERAGRLSLATDGEAWMVRIRGVEYGCGRVEHSERGHTEDGEPTYTPRAAVVTSAARYALADPDGPQEPPGSISFVGGPDGEPVMVVVGAPPAAEEYGALRQKIAKWKRDK